MTERFQSQNQIQARDQLVESQAQAQSQPKRELESEQDRMVKALETIGASVASLQQNVLGLSSRIEEMVLVPCQPCVVTACVA